MLKIARVTAFTVLELLRENQEMGGGKITSTQIRVKKFKLAYCSSKLIYLLDVEKHKKTVQKQ